MRQKLHIKFKHFQLLNMLRGKIVFSFLLSIFFPTFSFAQYATYFNKQYNLYSNTENAFSIVERGGNYFVCGFGANSFSQSFINFYCTDSAGNFLWEKEYGKPGFHYYPGWGGSLIQTSDGGFALGGTIVDSAYHNSALLMKFNSVGDTLWTNTFGNDSICVAYQCKQTSDNGYIIVGATDINSYWEDVLLIKTDSIGNEQWRQTLGGIQQDIGTSVIQTADGGYLVGGYTSSFGANINSYVVKTDSSGQLVWQTVLGGGYDEGRANVAQLNDGNYAVAGTYTFSQAGGPGVGSPFGKPFIAKLDTSGNTIWSQTYGAVKFNASLTSIHELPNGDLIGAGFCGGNSHMEGLVLKINSLGDSLWYRTYNHHPLNENFFYYSEPTSDQGLIACGVTWDYQNNYEYNMWVVKLDSLGCDTIGCNSVGIAHNTLSSSEIIVYPNPSSGTFTITNGNFNQVENSITIFDMFGRIVNAQLIFSGEKIQFDLSQYSSGIYLLEIRNEEGRNIYSQKIFKE